MWYLEHNLVMWKALLDVLQSPLGILSCSILYCRIEMNLILLIHLNYSDSMWNFRPFFCTSLHSYNSGLRLCAFLLLLFLPFSFCRQAQVKCWFNSYSHSPDHCCEWSKWKTLTSISCLYWCYHSKRNAEIITAVWWFFFFLKIGGYNLKMWWLDVSYSWILFDWLLLNVFLERWCCELCMCLLDDGCGGRLSTERWGARCWGSGCQLVHDYVGCWGTGCHLEQWVLGWGTGAWVSLGAPGVGVLGVTWSTGCWGTGRHL